MDETERPLDHEEFDGQQAGSELPFGVSGAQIFGKTEKVAANKALSMLAAGTKSVGPGNERAH
jgi:hypothetical protein